MENRKNRTRQIRKEVCFTPKEYEHVKMIMESMGIKKFQYYAVNQLQYGQVMTIDFSEIKQLVATKLSSSEKKALARRKNQKIRTYDEW